MILYFGLQAYDQRQDGLLEVPQVAALGVHLRCEALHMGDKLCTQRKGASPHTTQTTDSTKHKGVAPHNAQLDGFRTFDVSEHTQPYMKSLLLYLCAHLGYGRFGLVVRKREPHVLIKKLALDVLTPRG